MKRNILIIVFVSLALVLFIFFNRDTEIENVNQIETPNDLEIGSKIGNIAPDFSLVNYEGDTISLSDFEGRPVFLNFWASWCPFCIDEMPLMAAIQEELGEKYVTIAINREESLKLAKEYSDMIGVTGKYILLLDKEDKVYRQYSGFGMPYSVFIDSSGVIQDIKVGPLTRDQLLDKLEKIIK